MYNYLLEFYVHSEKCEILKKKNKKYLFIYEGKTPAANDQQH